MKDRYFSLALSGLFVLVFYSWGQAQWVAHSNPSSYHLYAMDAVTNDVAYAGGYGGSLVKTTDAGQSWSALHFGTSDWVSDIHFFNELHGWISTQSSLVQGTGELLETTDGGQTWTSRDNSKSFLAMSWPTASTGYACAFDGYMLKTTDGGQNWTQVTIPTTATLSEMQFLDDNRGYVMSIANKLYRTTDGGSTWTTLSLPSIEVFYFLDMDNGYIGDYYGKIGKTTDGGATFTYTQTRYDFTYRSIIFSDPSTGYIVGGLDCSSGSCTQAPSLLTTTDGGQTWVDNSHPFVGESKGFYKIDLAPNGMPFVAGSHSIIMTNPALMTSREYGQDLSIKVYPQPASNNLIIRLPLQAASIEIYSLSGALQHRSSLLSSELNLDISSWTAGLYMLRVMDRAGKPLGQKSWVKTP